MNVDYPQEIDDDTGFDSDLVTLESSDSLGFEKGYRKTSGPSTEDDQVLKMETESFDPSLSEFEAIVRNYVGASANQKDDDRQEIISELCRSVDIAERIDSLLLNGINSPYPGRLDSLIDVLCDSRINLYDYLLRKVFFGGVDFERLNEDAIYVLIKAAGKRNDSANNLLLSWALNQNRSECVREAAVEALADIGEEGALDKLKNIAADDKAESIRQIAHEYLAELNET